jgi:hypothetical protein
MSRPLWGSDLFLPEVFLPDVVMRQGTVYLFNLAGALLDGGLFMAAGRPLYEMWLAAKEP